MRYISRSSYETFSACERRGYNQYIRSGKGFSPALTPVNYAIGLLLHKGMEVLFLTKGDLNEALVGMQGLYEEEFSHLTLEDFYIARGSLLGWYRLKWVPFNEEFEVLLIEKEIECLLSPKVVLQARADLVVRARSDGRNWVFNWKTTSSLKDWNKKWRRDVQAWTEALAVEDFLGQRVEGCIFEGFYKGSKYAGMSTSPLVYGFFKEEKGKKLFRPDREKGWVKFPTWNGLFIPSQEEWILSLPLEVLEEQFIRSEFILKNDDVVRRWIRQVVREEEDREHILNSGLPQEEEEVFFIQRFGEQCNWCPFDGACGLSTDIPTLVNDGFLVEREDHHGKVLAEGQ